MNNSNVWMSAESPNYKTHTDKKYPYSEVPYMAEEYYVVKIPLSGKIKIVDYWGEGRIETEKLGFVDSYNVNYQYQTVRSGEDKGKKIPNRIPILDTHSDLMTEDYINDNSVITVTVMRSDKDSNISINCAKDIARIVDKDEGKVITYGFDEDSQHIKNLTDQLKLKNFRMIHKYTLPKEFLDIKFDKHITFLNPTTYERAKTELTQNLLKTITAKDYEKGVTLAKDLINQFDGDSIKEIFIELIKNKPRNCMTLAYNLWENKDQDVVRNYFPSEFSSILNGDDVVIIHIVLNGAMKLLPEDNMYVSHIDMEDKTSKNVRWKFISEFDKDSKNVKFKLLNKQYNVWLKYGNKDNRFRTGVYQAVASLLPTENDNDDNHKFYVEALVQEKEVGAFEIFNCEHKTPFYVHHADGKPKRVYGRNLPDKHTYWRIAKP